jgi:hypothetical protein
MDLIYVIFIYFVVTMSREEAQRGGREHLLTQTQIPLCPYQLQCIQGRSMRRLSATWCPSQSWREQVGRLIDKQTDSLLSIITAPYCSFVDVDG